MGQHTGRVVLGPILQSYPPFLVRQQTVEGTWRYPYYVLLPKRVITMPFRGEEYPITSTYDSRDGVPWVIYALREWLSDRPRIIRHWEDHLAVLQRPEEIARLAADLKDEQEAERMAEDMDASNSGAVGEVGEPRANITAEQVLANQRDELARIQQLTHEVTKGLHALEAAHPEAVAALDEVANEIARSRSHLNEG